MYEKRIIPPSLQHLEWPKQELFVVVNDFNASNLKDFAAECQKVILTGQEFLPVVIDSYGGQVYTLLGIIDFLQQIDVKVITICGAKAMSAGAVLFSCGKERYVGPQATIMVHEVSAGFWGKNIEFQNESKEVKRLNEKLFRILDKNTGQPSGFWYDLVDRNKNTDLFLSANQAIKYKLATHLGIPHIETKVEISKKLVVKAQG